jgi:hypothetical protein
VFLPLYLVHRFEFSSQIRSWKQEAYFLLGSWNPRRLNEFLGDLQLSYGDLPKLCGSSVATIGSLQLSCGVCPKLCAGSVTALKGPIVDRVFHLGGRARGDYGEPPWHLGSLVPPHHSNGD